MDIKRGKSIHFIGCDSSVWPANDDINVVTALVIPVTHLIVGCTTVFHLAISARKAGQGTSFFMPLVVPVVSLRFYPAT